MNMAVLILPIFHQHLGLWARLPLCIVALIFYCFIIWYRDWFGKNTFAYRLLMLPTSRLNLYIAKATTILLFILGLLADTVIALSNRGSNFTMDGSS